MTRQATLMWCLCTILALMGVLTFGCGNAPGDGLPTNNGDGGSDDGSSQDGIESGTIAGFLVDAENPDQGIADAFIYVPPIGSRASTRQANQAEAITGPNGEYTLSGLVAGLHTLVVEPADGAAYSSLELPAQVGQQDGLSLRITAAGDALLDDVNAIAVTPANSALSPGDTQPFAGAITDDADVEIAASLTWLVMGDIGTITSDGLFTAGDASASGAVIATLAGVMGSASVTIGDAPTNQPPTVTVTASATEVEPGAVVTITADASDPDGDDISLSWLATGASTDGSGNSITWTAPTRTERYHVTCLAIDSRGAQATADVGIRVRTLHDEGWESWDGSEYRAWGEEGTWAEANVAAQALGAHLATLGSESEEYWVRHQISEDEMWIGFTDSEEFSAAEGNWRWVNGNSVEYTNWGDGEPNDERGQDFAVMNWRGLSQWDDKTGTHTADAVFERAADGGDGEND